MDLPTKPLSCTRGTYAFPGHGTKRWAPALRRGFPGLRSHKREAVYAPVNRLYRLRNRIAHHEPIHSLNHTARHQELLRVAAWIDPAAAAWITATSRVPCVAATRPGAQTNNRTAHVAEALEHERCRRMAEEDIIALSMVPAEVADEVAAITAAAPKVLDVE